MKNNKDLTKNIKSMLLYFSFTLSITTMNAQNTSVEMIIHAGIVEDDSQDETKDIRVLEINPYTWGNEENVFSEIPKFLQFIEGRYRNSDETDCKLSLDIIKEKTAYRYELQVNEKPYEGLVTFYRDGDMHYITLEGIPWKDNMGMIGEDDLPVDPDIEPAYGIDLLWDDGELTFQNYGNSMNYYVKTDCAGKFITLVKDSVKD